MLRKLRELRGYRVQGTDGELGKIEDFLFDDQDWTIRYIVVDTGGWLLGRKVPLSPVVLGEPDWDHETFSASLTQAQVERGPQVDLSRTLSYEQENELVTYYAWPVWWGAGGLGQPGAMGAGYPVSGPVIPAVPLVGDRRRADEGDTIDEGRIVTSAHQEAVAEHRQRTQNLRSAREVLGYDVQAREDEVGDVHDFIIDSQNWTVRYLVIDTGKLLPGKKVLLAPRWVGRVSWTDKEIYVDLDPEAIRNSPAYDPDTPLEHGYEERLYRHYDKPGYWES